MKEAWELFVQRLGEMIDQSTQNLLLEKIYEELGPEAVEARQDSYEPPSHGYDGAHDPIPRKP